MWYHHASISASVNIFLTNCWILMKLGLTIMLLWITLNLYYKTSYRQQYQHCGHAHLCSKSDGNVATSRLKHVPEIFS